MIALGIGQQDTDPPHPVRVLRARSEWPYRGGAAEKGDELPSPHGVCPQRTQTKSVTA